MGKYTISRTFGIRAILLSVLCVTSVFAQPNNPYPNQSAASNTYYASFAAPPKTLDPARAYSSDAYAIIGQIYQPPLQYAYLLRPYQLEPLTLTQMPTVQYFSQQGRRLPDQTPAAQVAYSIYTLHVKPGLYYQPHPALARNAKGHYLYHHLTSEWWRSHPVRHLQDFPQQGTREVVAADYVYAIKRLADPTVQSPILGIMQQHIVGLAAYSKRLAALPAKQRVDLRQLPLAGVRITGRYTYQIKLNGQYPQFLYWLAMPFFAPMPWEATVFAAQTNMAARNLTLNWYPLGTGPYYLFENDPNRQMQLKRNPHYQVAHYPAQGSAADRKAGLLQAAGKVLPFIDTLQFTLEKESLPRWNKFLQGYYDVSGISADSFDQAIQVDAQGEPHLTAALQQKGIRLQTTVEPAIFYMGFNMLDPVVGGQSVRARKLRQAISILLNYEEYIAIFLNGRGVVAQGPIPPGIFGYHAGRAGLNSVVYRWQAGKAVRRSLLVAKRLLAEAGYPSGRSRATGKPLVLNYDVPASSGPDDKARFDWFRKQFAKLGIDLHVRATQYNRFQQKMRTGHAQLFSWGWHADYPDPENFLFLLYGPNGKVKQGGENAANYNNAQYNRLFEQMRSLPNGPKRAALIAQMVQLVQQDAPWIWGVFPKTFVLKHDWVGPSKPNAMANNTLKYLQINTALRAKQREAWNRPVWWPIVWALLLLAVVIVPVAVRYWIQEHRPRRRV